MSHVIKLAKEHDTFYCPINRVHLYYYSPSGTVTTITDYVKRALDKKRIIDVHGTIRKELEQGDLETPIVPEEPVDENPIQEPVEPTPKSTPEPTVVEEEEGIDLSQLNKEELLSFVKTNGMTIKELGITSRSTVAKIREAIEEHLLKESKNHAETN